MPRPAAPAPARRCGSTGGVWFAWLVLYAFVAVQVAWLLRPYVASRAEGTPPFVRHLGTHGSIFDWIGTLFSALYGY